MQPSVTSFPAAEGVAIVGIGCVLPGGVTSADQLWEFLCNGRDAIVEVPPDRWNIDAVYSADPGVAGTAVTRWGGFVSDIAAFDAAFFGISPREAAVMDPQQRLLLETAWRALEDAGIPLHRVAGSRTGVYIGISHSDYNAIQQFGRYEIDVHTSTGGALSIAANRISHRFDLKGPSLALDTACSSSLVALDLACRALARGECELALVGGVNAMLTPDVTITFSRASMLSPDGHCKAFDARANGYVRGEGAGVVVIKPLARAVADGDNIYAVIRATGVNQDGRTSTITVPSLTAQVEMLRETCREASIEPGQVGYVEAHGTGTPVGDPIEAEAIGTVFGKLGPHPCLIGSIKTNIGHLEPAAGIAGLIKAALCVERAQIPPSLHFETLNPNIRASEWGIEVCRRLSDFPTARSSIRLAAVNSFGFGGTNACTILEEPPRRTTRRAEMPEARYPTLLPISAGSESLLRTYAGQLAHFLGTKPTALADVAGTLATRRSTFDRRAVIVTSSCGDAAERLTALAEGRTDPNVVVGRSGIEPRVAFVFTGQGAQWWAMGRDLLESDPVFATAVAECDSIFQRLSGWSIVDELRRDEASSRINQTAVAQPATLAVQVALAARWKAWGVEPSAVVGHSIGEMAAACVARTLSVEDAVAVVFHRSRLQEKSRYLGTMAAVGLSVAETNRLLAAEKLDLEIAAINGTEIVTVGGTVEEIDRLLVILSRTNVFGRRLQVDYAFHTRQMDPFAEELLRNLAGVSSYRGDIPMYSTVTGKAVSPRELNAEYWRRNMREPVQFHAAIDAAIADGFNTFIELGAHPILTGPIRQCLADRGRAGIAVASLHRPEPSEVSMARAAAELYCNGVVLDWPSMLAPERQLIRLPVQPMERKPFWMETEDSRAVRLDGPTHPLLGYRSKSSVWRWQGHASATSPHFLADHRVDGSLVFPAAGYVEMALAAAREVFGDPAWEIDSINFHDALIFAEETITVLETIVDPARHIVEIRSRNRGDDASWILRASARLRAWTGDEPKLETWRPKIEPPSSFDNTRFYRQLKREGHDYGPAFRGVMRVWHEGGEALGQIKLPAEAGADDKFLIHPPLLDACFQLILAFTKFDIGTKSTIALPRSIARMRFFRRPGSTVFVRASAVKETSSEITSDIAVLDESGRVVLLIESLTCQRLTRSNIERYLSGPELYRERWIASANPESVTETRGQSWLLLADRSTLAEHLAVLIRRNGGRAILVRPGAACHRYDADMFECSAKTPSLQMLFENIASPIDHIVDFRSLLRPEPGELDDRYDAQTSWGLQALIALVQSISPLAKGLRVSVVTAATGLENDRSLPSEWQISRAGLLGAIRTIANERSELVIRAIQIDEHDLSADALFAELCASTKENEIVLRKTQRLIGRLERITVEALPFRRGEWLAETRTPAFQVTMTAPGVIDNLVLREISEPQPATGEVMIEVRAVGLNFRDVMAATGLLPPEAEDGPAWQRLGFEAAGIVRAVGANVDTRLIGRRVIAVTAGCFASHIVASATLVFPITDDLSFETAAAQPIAFVTARYALVTLGRIRKGETILVHAASGGVGLAAIEIARRRGAAVIATAGNPKKRDYLRKLGVPNVFDSRSLGFADDVLKVTERRGVDLVLNSLPDQFLEKSLSLLAPGGRFLEIGKRDIYADTPIGLRSLRQNASFSAIDLARLAFQQPHVVQDEVRAIFDAFDSGELSPLPIERFGLGDIADAFKHMAKANHIGKIVISFDAPAQVELISSAAQFVRSDATYLVTGGTSGLGLAIAQWLVDKGARSLILLGRNGATAPHSGDVVARMNAHGAQVTALAADVTDRQALQRVISSISSNDRPLAGVIHAAGIIDDAMVNDLDSERMRRVVEPKVMGAWNLHELTADIPLDFFVCISSIAAILGSVGQAHYAAANRSLEALANARRAAGLPGLAVALGPIADVGYLTRRPDVARHLDALGVRPMNLQETLDALEALMTRECAVVAVADLNWPAMSRSNPVLCAQPRLAAHASAYAVGAQSGQFRTYLMELPENARAKELIAYLREQIGSVLKLQAESIDPDRLVSELGLDSLTSFELKNRVERTLGISLPLGSFLQKPTINKLIVAIAQKLSEAETSAVASVRIDGAGSEPIMSIGQEALWYTDQLAPGSPAYNLAMCIAVRPALNLDLVDQAFRELVARHDSLRLAFPADALGPMPRHLDPAGFELIQHNVVHLDPATFREVLNSEGNRPFDLSNGPLIRLHCFRRTDSDVLMLQVHHIVADAASLVICLGEMFETYFGSEAGTKVRHSHPALASAAFATWQRRMVEEAEGRAHAAYWRRQLDGLPDAISLPTDFPHPATPRGPGSSRVMNLPPELAVKLKRLAGQKSQTLFTLLLAAFNALLHRLSGDTDILVGIPTLNRIRPELAQAVGYLVNPVPIRTRLDAAGRFDTLLAQVGETVRAALEHQEYPFQRVVRDLDLPREPDRTPIFQTLFAMERPAAIDSKGFAATLLNVEGANLEVGNFKVESVPLRRDRAQFELSFVMEEFEERIIGIVDYRTDLWEPGTIDRLIARFTAILEAVVETPEISVAELVVDEHRHEPLVGPDMPDYPDVFDVIHAMAARYPSHIAVESKNGSWTYRQLIDRAAGIAAALRTQGVPRQALVGICISRSAELIAAILAVWQIDAAYVPLDASHPAERLTRILGDTTPSIIISDDSSADVFSNFTDCPIIRLNSVSRVRSAEFIHFPIRQRNTSDLAYVIHTSGSTGGPLGVEVRRDSVSSFLAAMALELPITASDSLLAVTTIGFDIAVMELFLLLSLGGRVTVADEEVARDGVKLGKRLTQGDITVMQATPATWRLLIEAGWNGDATFKALVGGERLERGLANDLLQRAAGLWNLYGPTETTVWSTCAQVFAGAAAVPIGNPIANTRCWVVDEEMHEVRPGVLGELLIGGAGVARGYRNRPELTRMRFVQNPFDHAGGTLCFRTGDMVRHSESGLFFAGRRDQQVKIRGHRIELGEIEAALCEHPAVVEAVALPQAESIERARICAFVVLRPDAATEESVLSAHLKRVLTSYMIPSSIEVISTMPRLPNGKTDRAQLKALAERRRSNFGATRPRNATERILAVLLADILEIEQVRIEDDFFAVGGTSLLGMRYLARASDAFQIDLGPLDLLNAPTIGALAHLIAERRTRNGAKYPANMPSVGPTVPTMWRPLPLCRAEGVFDKIDGAAIAYLPDELTQLATLRSQLLRAQNGEPYWLGTCRTSLGTIALIIVPLSGRDLFLDSAMTQSALNRAIDYASRLGACNIALTGVIPAATETGLSLTAPDGVALTHGYAATGSAVTLTMAAAAHSADRDLKSETICFVGLGAIGRATLRTVLTVLDHPRALMLCDVPAKRSYLEALAHDIRIKLGFRGEIDISTLSPDLSDKTYQARFFVGATNSPQVIDVERLRPGSIVVDGLFPLCFDPAAALRRFNNSADVLCLTGDSLRLGEQFKWTIALPPGIPTVLRNHPASGLLPPENIMTGCILSSILPGAAGLRPILGPPQASDIRAYWKAFKDLGLDAAPLHCGAWSPSHNEILKFKTFSGAGKPATARGTA
jgi:amino acid adenylation domain-containing protein